MDHRSHGGHCKGDLPGICDHYGYEYITAYLQQLKEAEQTLRYQSVDELPQWAKAETQELIDLGALRGNEKGLDVTEDMLRTMIINLRATKALLSK